jgi:glyoxylase-like metal-dependent hydrolase (beta-lactamase superfamily II)
MPQVIDLGNDQPILRGVNMIVGDGLCSNIYVVGREKATIIDTGVGNRLNPVWPQLNSIGVKPENVDKVILTHAHHDHAMGTFLILEKAHPMVYVQTKDTGYIASSLGESLVKAEEGDVIETQLWPLEVIWTPGHTEGGMCLYARKQRILFSGDTAFPDGYFGRFDGESGNIEDLIESLRKLTNLKVDVMLSGHGVPVLRGAEDNLKLALRNAELYV